MMKRVLITVDGDTWQQVKPLLESMGLTRSRYIDIVLRTVVRSRNLTAVQKQAFAELLGLGENAEVNEKNEKGGLRTGTLLRYRDKTYEYSADGLETDDGLLSPATVDKMIQHGVIQEVRS